MKLTQPSIQYVGLTRLTDAEIDVLKTLSFEYQDKIQREMETPTTIVVTVKLHESKGARTKRKKYSIRVKTVSAKRTLETKHAHDWDLARALHKAFKNMESLVLHQFRKGSQNTKLGTRKGLLAKLKEQA